MKLRNWYQYRFAC